ncbi:hypothetical protein B0T21DRAFT_291010 [Apiosordaria backusii]|uniref:Pyridoxal phosphate homeostasis protein n=1 Tax=Apiosordaria backusii TaxID=314023 RepID=A0AA40BED2_9PEZI|nr:hypothetical protein B0T21DRAFT_291010 [Apiosordaria backusii]
MNETTEMKVDPARASALISQLQGVKDKIAAVAKGRPVRLVAVSKLKPANDILALHSAPQTKHLHFGENYSQELSQKAELLPRTIQWHFIGGLQSKHTKSLAKIPNLFCVSSIDTLKKASLLDKYRGEQIKSNISSPISYPKIKVHVQVNTSGEESKSGCSPGQETVELCKKIENDCPNLELLGLMTIGAIARSRETTPENENEDFVVLREQRDLVRRELGLGEGRRLELSMGMSEDFEGAVAMGSDEVRVGSTIFGVRGRRGRLCLLFRGRGRWWEGGEYGVYSRWDGCLIWSSWDEDVHVFMFESKNERIRVDSISDGCYTAIIR